MNIRRRMKTKYLNSISVSSRIIGSPSWKVSCELYWDSSWTASSVCITWLSSFVRNWVRSTVCCCVFWCVLLWSINICNDVNWLLHLPHWNISSSSWSIAGKETLVIWKQLTLWRNIDRNLFYICIYLTARLQLLMSEILTGIVQKNHLMRHLNIK